MTDDERLRELAEAALPDAAEVITAIRRAVEFYVWHWYETNGGDEAKLKEDGPVARMLEFLLVANPQSTIALLDRITSLSKEVESLNAECATIAANTREARIVIQQVAEVVGCDWQGDVAAAVRAEVERVRGECIDIDGWRKTAAEYEGAHEHLDICDVPHDASLIRRIDTLANQRDSAIRERDESRAAWDAGVAELTKASYAQVSLVTTRLHAVESARDSALAETTRLKQALGEAEKMRPVYEASLAWAKEEDIDQYSHLRSATFTPAERALVVVVMKALGIPVPSGLAAVESITKEHGHNGE